MKKPTFLTKRDFLSRIGFLTKITESLKELRTRYKQRKLPNWYKNLRKKLKHLFRSENLSKLIILLATLALIATSILPYLL